MAYQRKQQQDGTLESQRVLAVGGGELVEALFKPKDILDDARDVLRAK